MTFPPAPALARAHAHEVRLQGGLCSSRACGATTLPFRESCPTCGKKMKRHVFTPVGTVLYTTVVHTPPPGFEERTPYVIGLIELEEGVRLMAHIVDSGETIEVGAAVEGVVRRLHDRDDGGPLHYAMAFRVTG